MTRKEDVILVLYYEVEYDLPITILIRNKEYDSTHDIDFNRLSFIDDFDELSIIFSEDEWVSNIYTDMVALKLELEKRGFLVVYSENNKI